MKKLFLTSGLIFCIVCPAFADNENITDENKGCTSNTLTVDSGTAALEADWSANTVGVTFYNGDTQYSSGQCTYDGTLTLPSTDPTKTGYTFNGWKVRAAAQPTFDITTLAQYASRNGTAYAYITFGGTESTYKAYSSYTRNTPATYNLTNNGEWATEFSYGTIKGTSRCSTVGSGYSVGQNGEPTDDLNTGQYCWCKVTGYDAEKDGSYLSPVASLWAFNVDGGSAANCASLCTDHCGYRARSIVAPRVGLFRATYCPNGATRNGSTCICQTGNYDANNWQCVVCNGSSTWNGSSCTCPSGYEYNGNDCEEEEDMGFFFD